MKHLKLKNKSFQTYLIALIGGFGMGYGANTIVENNQNPQIVLENTVSVCFTPDKRCKSQILRELDRAKKSIHLQAYSFTDKDISLSLIKAQKRGVSVKVILDKSNIKDKKSAKKMLFENGIPLRFDHPNGIAHSKVIIIDEEEVLTGSYNFSVSAYRRNTENLLIIRNKQLSEKYMENWQNRWNLSNS